MPRLLLVDGSNYLFRAFHALPPLTTSRGEPSGAVKGFHGMLKNVKTLIAPDYAACVFDAPGKNFRHEIFPEYKANRPPMPDELRSQIKPILEMVKLEGWPLLQIEGVEADDVLATLAKAGEAAGWEVFIATGDKDLAQVVNDKIKLVNTMTREILDREKVKEKYGVGPEGIIDYLALMGDKVDNVPGITKCGPVTAAKWINAYGSIDNLTAHAAEVKGKIGENLRAGLPFLSTAQKLVTINLAAPVPKTVTELTFATPDETKLAAFYEHWEMRSALGKKAAKKPVEKQSVNAQQGDLFGAAPVTQALAVTPTGSDKTDVIVADTADKLSLLKAKLSDRTPEMPPVAMALLTDGEHFLTETPTGLAIAFSPLERWYVPLAHDAGVNAGSEDVKNTLADWLASSAPKLMHDVKYACHVLVNLGLPVVENADDTMLMSYVLEAHLKHDLASVVARTCATLVPSDEDLLGKGTQKKRAATLSVAEAASVMTLRAAVIRTAGCVMRETIAADAGLSRIYRTVELPVSRVLGQMERTGVLVDVAKLAALSAEMDAEIRRIKADIETVAGEKFNPASPKQLAAILFDKLGLPVKKKTASGTPSTDEEVLTELALNYPLPKLILDYRRLAKLKGTYTDKLPELTDAGHRVHTTFGQATAVTGRLASSEPNLQNIPVRTGEGRRIREAFIAPEGCKIISADYSQIELRIMAHISGDEGLLKAFRAGADIHRATAAEVLGIAPESVTPDQRRMAKVINFGLIYGMSAFGLAQNLGIDRKVAASYIEQYFARYPKVAKYMESTRVKAQAQGYVETAFGRRLQLPDIRSSRANIRAAAERAAINAPMQGTAADLIKMAMISVAEWIKHENLKSRLVLQVHDELILEVPEDEVAIVKVKVPELMAGVASLSVPLIAEVGTADNWEAAH